MLNSVPRKQTSLARSRTRKNVSSNIFQRNWCCQWVPKKSHIWKSITNSYTYTSLRVCANYYYFLLLFVKRSFKLWTSFLSFLQCCTFGYQTWKFCVFWRRNETQDYWLWLFMWYWWTCFTSFKSFLLFSWNGDDFGFFLWVIQN